MNASLHRRARDIFLEVCARPEQERAALLAGNCVDTQLRREVESLIEHHDAEATLAPVVASREVEAREQNHLCAGAVFAGRYRIIELLGEGGTGSVYRTHDLTLDVPVALKLLAVPGPAGLEQLCAEVRMARRVTHPALCRVHDVGVHEGRSFLTQEYVDGEDLRGLVRRVGRLVPERVLEIGRQLADALAAAHASGVLHRDIKPSNILLDRAGRIHVTDFGISAMMAAPANGSHLGTPAYMAPELLLPGAPASESSDLYAFGLVLHEILTGRPVFRANSAAELFELHRYGTPAPPSKSVPDVDPRLEQVILHALAKDPAARPASARSVAHALSGELVPANPGALVPSATVEERRPLTVMRLRLDGPLRLMQRFDLEEAGEALRARQTLAAERIAENGGLVASYRNDGLVAHFGFPVAHDDDADRALRASLEIRDGLIGLDDALEARCGERQRARIGIDTGEVLIEEFRGAGLRQVLGFGGPTEVAERLAATAPADSIALSDATLARARSRFFTAPGRLESFDGFAELIASHRLLTSDELEPRVDAHVPLLGRAQELGLLLDRWERVREGSGQVVLVRGPAGIGKTRLLQELRDRLRPDASHGWLQAFCSPRESGIPFAPLRELLEATLEIESGAREPRKRKLLERHLAQLGLANRTNSALLSSLLGQGQPAEAALVAGPSPDEARRRTIELLIQWIVSLGQRRPTCLVVEDLCWCDPSTLELLDLLIPHLATANVLLALSFRRDFEPRWARHSYQTEISLSRLSNREGEDMVARAGPNLPRADVERILDRADGVPLFLEELTRAALERATADGSARALQPPHSEIPPGLESVLVAQLDRLGPAKEVAQHASVIGRDFSYDLLAAVTDVDADTLRGGLARLLDEEVVYRKGTGQRAAYTFQHALILEAAYASMARSRRESLHRRLAEFLSRAPERVEPELVAHHFEQAGPR